MFPHWCDVGQNAFSRPRFSFKNENPRYDGWWHDACTQLLPVLDSEDAKLLQAEIAALDENLGEHLPSGIIHADLFKDNVLLNGDEVSGFIDFYYACNGNFMYDLAIAVTTGRGQPIIN